MEFAQTTRRHRLELIGLELIAALTKTGFPRNKCIIEIYLAVFSDGPWTILGLAHASRMDRAIIRDHVKRGVQAGEFEHSIAGFTLTTHGKVMFMRRMRLWQRNIRPDIRKFLYKFFKATSGHRSWRDYLMFLLSLDRTARLVKMEYSYIAAYVIIEWEAGPHGITIREAAERTGFSYCVIHKQISKLADDKIIKRQDGRYVMTRAGRRYSFFQFIWSWRAVTMKEWRLASKMMTFQP
ncbi:MULTISPECIES: hypothetical protein [unclassified Ruegeria]|uniref:hypothetical protein n=1 Tax=unclassified Ruegeria TaxID=2625375 RepID=UPI001488BC24|nr:MULTISPECIES: hypothetical protein [unclassified Ruegeria]